MSSDFEKFETILRHATPEVRRELFEYLRNDPAGLHELVDRFERKRQALAAGDQRALEAILTEERRQTEKFLAALKADTVKSQLTTEV